MTVLLPLLKIEKLKTHVVNSNRDINQNSILQSKIKSDLQSNQQATAQFNTESNWQSPSQEEILKGINFEVRAGETFVLLGESGSGKSITALSIMQLLPRSVFFGQESRILFQGSDLLSLPESKIRKMRGSDIAMIFQEPMTSLNPVFTVGEQIAEALRLHQKLSRKGAHQETLTLLEAVQIKDPIRVQKSYPHQLSGGMKQRAMIAMALAGKPKLLIADEPTTALDVTTQAQILQLLKQLQAEHQMAILFITHDLAVAKKMGQRVGIMHQGHLVEQGEILEVLNSPKNAYTAQLLEAKPKQRKEPPAQDGEEILSLDNLSIYFPVKSGFFQKTVSVVQAVDDVSLQVKSGETLALVGESGCGKTTLAKAVLALTKPSAGQVSWLGQPIQTLKSRELRARRSDFQIIFQDPYGAMDPKFRVLDIIEEGLRAFNVGTNAKEREERVDVLLEQVGLKAEYKYRYPHQFSGGQRQRICIARALAVGPRFIVCDEPTSSLDVTVAAQIMDLLLNLQQEYEISYLFITHNMSVVRAMAHNVAVMQAGKIVEYGSCDEVLNNPKHAYTRTLLDAVMV